MASDLTRSFSMIAKEQSSMMDYGVMDSILPVWTVRFATITEFVFITGWFNRMNRSSSRSSFTNCNESWFAILVKEQNRVSLILLNRFSCCKKRAWNDMLLDSCFWTMNYPKCRVFVLGCSFSRVKQSTSLQSIQMEGWCFYETPLFSFVGCWEY